MSEEIIKKKRGRPFKKGQFVPSSANQKMSEEDRELRNLTRVFARNVIARHSTSTYKDLKEALKTPNDIPCLELLVMKAMASAIEKSDVKKLDWIYMQLFGKPKEFITEDKRITLQINNAQGELVTNQDLQSLDKDNLKQIVGEMIKHEY